MLPLPLQNVEVSLRSILPLPVPLCDPAAEHFVRGVAMNQARGRAEMGRKLLECVAIPSSGECCVDYGGVASRENVVHRASQICIHPGGEVLGVDTFAQRRPRARPFIDTC